MGEKWAVQLRPFPQKWVINIPLKALKDNKEIYSWNLTEEIRDNNKFYCPVCGNEMQGIIPEKDIIKHFRHKKGKKHNSESKQHLRLKKIIYNQADKLGYDAELEHIIENDSEVRIADVLIGDNNVVEVQCSQLSYDDFVDRHNFYVQQGYNDLWILGNHYYQLASDTKHDDKRNFDYNTIQRVPRKILKTLDQKLYYFNNNVDNFYITGFNFKDRRGSRGLCNTKGWYNFRKIDLRNILFNEGIIDRKT